MSQEIEPMKNFIKVTSAACMKQKLSEPVTTSTSATSAISDSLQKGHSQPGSLPHSDNTVAGSMAQAQQVDCFLMTEIYNPTHVSKMYAKLLSMIKK